ncbi:MAG: TRASH domain-containing protein [Ignavibacteriales bacterium]|nr:MAG: TRASH domain-containing protein [Ignavibacteriales bacterium]
MKFRLLLAAVFFVSLTLVSFAQDKTAKDSKAKTTKEVVGKKSSDIKKEEVKKNETKTVKMANNKVCPVSGEELEDNSITYTYKGVTYGLCCKKCLAKVEKNPEKYISRLSEDGKSLKKM